MTTAALVVGWVWMALALAIVVFGLLCIAVDMARGLRHPLDDAEARQLRKAREVTGTVVPLPRRDGQRTPTGGGAA